MGFFPEIDGPTTGGEIDLGRGVPAPIADDGAGIDAVGHGEHDLGMIRQERPGAQGVSASVT